MFSKYCLVTLQNHADCCSPWHGECDIIDWSAGEGETTQCVCRTLGLKTPWQGLVFVLCAPGIVSLFLKKKKIFF